MERMRTWTSPRRMAGETSSGIRRIKIAEPKTGLFFLPRSTERRRQQLLPQPHVDWTAWRKPEQCRREGIYQYELLYRLYGAVLPLNLSCCNHVTAEHPILTWDETIAQSRKVDYRIAKLKHVTYGNAWITHIYNFVFLEVSGSVLQENLWKYQIFKSRQTGISLIGSVTQIHYEPFGSNTVYAAVRVSVLRTQTLQNIALFLDVFIICHFSISKESTKLYYTLLQGFVWL